MKVAPITGSDCEVIIHLYLKYGIEQTLLMLDGVYAFVLYDNRMNKTHINNFTFCIEFLFATNLHTLKIYSVVLSHYLNVNKAFLKLCSLTFR